MLKDKSFVTILTVFVTAVLMVVLSLVLGSIGFGKDLAFYAFASLAVLSAIGVVTLRNMVYAGFLLVLSFVSIAGIYVLLNADFLAAAQILINGGAVTIMVIFAIMLTNSTKDSSNIPYSFEYRFVAFVLSSLGIFLVLLLRMMGINFNIWASPFLSREAVGWNIQTPVEINTTEQIGRMFFGQYLIPFEVASIVLLMALIGAIVLAMRDTDMTDSLDEVKNPDEDEKAKLEDKDLVVKK